jgi:hypothetical protein
VYLAKKDQGTGVLNAEKNYIHFPRSNHNGDIPLEKILNPQHI